MDSESWEHDLTVCFCNTHNLQGGTSEHDSKSDDRTLPPTIIGLHQTTTLTAQQHHQVQNIISSLPLVATAMILPSLDQFFGAAYVVQAGAIAAAAHSNMARRSRKGQVAQERQRNSVSDNYQWLGPKIFRRAYRMDYDSFWKLYSILNHTLTQQLKE